MLISTRTSCVVGRSRGSRGADGASSGPSYNYIHAHSRIISIVTIYKHIVIIYTHTWGTSWTTGFASLPTEQSTVGHTCHILLPSEIDLGLCLAVFAGSGGKHLFHRICPLVFYNPAKPSGRGGGRPPAGRVTYWSCKAKA